MAENQNPVFTDSTLGGDGTSENPLTLGGSPKNSLSMIARSTVDNPTVMDGTEQTLTQLDLNAPGALQSFTIFLQSVIQFTNDANDDADLTIRIWEDAVGSGVKIYEATQTVNADQPNAAVALIGGDSNNTQADPSIRSYFLTAQRTTGTVTTGEFHAELYFNLSGL